MQGTGIWGGGCTCLGLSSGEGTPGMDAEWCAAKGVGWGEHAGFTEPSPCTMMYARHFCAFTPTMTLKGAHHYPNFIDDKTAA